MYTNIHLLIFIINKLLNKMKFKSTKCLKLAAGISAILIILSYDNFRKSNNNKKAFDKNTRGIFCLIILDQLDFNKVKFSHDIWASKCDNHLYISNDIITDTHKFSSHGLNIIKPHKLQSAVSISATSNVYAAFEHVYHKHATKGYDWYLKVHESTFVFVDNLRRFIRDKNMSEPVTYSYSKDNKLVSSAAGYLLSGSALKRLGSHLVDNTNSNKCVDTLHEDADMTRCFQALGINSRKSIDSKGLERFYPYSLNTLKYYFPKYQIQKVKYIQGWNFV